jgi:PAS domain S-box-containing protein
LSLSQACPASDFAGDNFDFVSAPIIVIDRGGLFVYANRIFESATGLKRQDLLGRYIGDYLPETEAEAIAQFLEDLQAGNFPPQHQQQWPGEDGTPRSISWKNQCVVDGSGETTYVVSTGLDVTVPGVPGDGLHLNPNSAGQDLGQLELQRRGGILEVVSFAAEKFLESTDWETQIDLVLARLGEATQVSRVYLFENDYEPNGARITSQRFEWTAPGISPQISNPLLQRLPATDPSFHRMAEALSRAEIVQGNIADFPAEAQNLFTSQDILSLVCVPIFVGKDFWGFIGLDECARSREWSHAEIEALQAAASLLGSAIDRARSARVLLATAQISDAAHSANDLDEFYAHIHQIVAELMPARSFFVALYDEETDIVSYPYFVDEFDPPMSPGKLGKGLTAYVLRSGKTLFISPNEFEELENAGEVENIGTPSIDWLGVPLKSQGKVFGVLAVQSYTPGIRYKDSDKNILEFVSNQVAMAIERIRSEQALRTSEKLYRTLVETSPDAVTLTDLQGNILVSNLQAALNIGFERPEDLIGQNVYKFIIPEQISVAQNGADETLERGALSDNKEFVVIRKDGSLLPIELNASVVQDANGQPTGFIGVSRDISLRKRRDHEQKAIITMSSALRTAKRRDEMIPLVVENLAALLSAQAAVLVTGAVTDGEHIVERGYGLWAGLAGQAVTNRTYFDHPSIVAGNPLVLKLEDESPERGADFFAPTTELQNVIGVPLICQNQYIGSLWVGLRQELQEDALPILSAISDISANAIHRATLHEQTQRRLQKLAALRSVDMAISASLDLRVALNVLLDQLTVQLNVDASAVLIYNKHPRSLEYSAGRGFRTNSIYRSVVNLGEGPAGKAALDRRTCYIEDLDEEPAFIQSRGLSGEGFVSYCAVPLVAKGQLKGLLEVFNRSHLKPDTEWLEFFETMAGQAAIAVDNATLFNDLQRSNMELALAYDITLEGWVHALDMRDQEAEGHTRRVMDMTMRIARALGKTDNELIHIRRGVLLHDIGKIAIPDEILLKPGPLSEAEWEIMRKHPVYAYELLSPINYLKYALDIPYCHHEKWDGTGYPRGLHGEQIPLAARIFAVVDVWDAMRSDRPYRPRWTDDKVREYIQSNAGLHFDPQMVGLFMEIWNGEGD